MTRMLAAALLSISPTFLLADDLASRATSATSPTENEESLTALLMDYRLRSESTVQDGSLRTFDNVELELDIDDDNNEITSGVIHFVSDDGKASDLGRFDRETRSLVITMHVDRMPVVLAALAARRSVSIDFSFLPSARKEPVNLTRVCLRTDFRPESNF